MDAQEVIERLARMTNSTVESERIFDELFDEWQQQNTRIAELEQQLAEAQPLIELGLATQQAQEQAQQD
jgi:hypothetical protein